MAAEIGFEPRDLTRITAAISELARNIIAYAKRGEIVLLSMDQERRHGIAVTGRDDGPGILDVSQAIKTGEGQGTELLITIPRENADVSANYHR
jgi:serine/threonine-protein kinase RsbT